MSAADVVVRNGLVSLRAWKASFFLSVLAPVMFLTAMGVGLGSLVREGDSFGGVDYLSFLATGMLAANAMQNGVFGASYPILNKIIWQRNYEALLASPMSVKDVFLGELGWAAVSLAQVAIPYFVVMAFFGIFESALALLAIPAAILLGLSCFAPVMALTARLHTDEAYTLLFRLGGHADVPSQRNVLSGRRAARVGSMGGADNAGVPRRRVDQTGDVVRLGTLGALARCLSSGASGRRNRHRYPDARETDASVMATRAAPVDVVVSPRRALKLVRRNVLAYKHYWIAFVTGFFDPVFYLAAVGFGVGQFIESVPYAGTNVDYATFLAPGLLATATLNGAVFDGFFGPFFKLNWMKTYDGIVTTPISIADIAIGEIVWAVIRGTAYGAAFLVVIGALGLVESAWVALAVPAVALSAAALSAGAMILTSITKQISSLEKVMTLVVIPLFLFSGTFYPLSVYPGYLQTLVQATPLYHSAALLRSLTTGEVATGTLWHVAYLIAFFLLSTTVVVWRLRKRLVW